MRCSVASRRRGRSSPWTAAKPLSRSLSTLGCKSLGRQERNLLLHFGEICWKTLRASAPKEEKCGRLGNQQRKSYVRQIGLFDRAFPRRWTSLLRSIRINEKWENLFP